MSRPEARRSQSSHDRAQRRLVLSWALAGLFAIAPSTTTAQAAVARGGNRILLDSAFRQAARLPRIRSVLVAYRGRLVRERYFHGASRERPHNIKSASKSIMSALVGIAIEQKRIGSVRQPIGTYFSNELAGEADRRKAAITIEDLLTMRSGLETTSFYNYERWVNSSNWVRFALAQPMTANPGDQMNYSTGSTHLLSAILTHISGMTTLRFANRYLAEPLGITIARWQRDPQGIYFGGNDMFLTSRAMLAFGNLYLGRGRSAKGRQIVPSWWVDSSFVTRTRSGWSGNDYGYGWWSRTLGGQEAHFAWGYGGQMIFVVPDADLTVVMTSDPESRSREGDHLDALYDIMDRFIVPAFR